MLPKFLLGTCLVLLAVGLSVMIADAQGPTRNPRSPRALVGTAFTYQGQLKKSGGLVTSTCNFQFGLWDALSGDTQVGTTQTIPSLVVTNGLFTTPIDFGNNAFNGDARWLATAVQCTGDLSYTALNPRQTLNPAPMAFALPGLYTQQNSTSPNVIGGYSGNSVTSGIYGATIAGGGQSGSSNSVANNFGTVGGGLYNRASGNYTTIGGGINNSANGWSVTLGGGANHTANGEGATVGGGNSNYAIANYATVGGGNVNTASGFFATVPGGQWNSATMTYTLAAGRHAKANHQGAFVWGDSTDADVVSTGNDQFVVRANGGVRIVRGTNVFTDTGAALQAEHADWGEAAWLRLSSPSNPWSVIALIKSTSGSNNFLQCYNESSGTYTSKCHIDSTGAFVGGSDFAESLAAVGNKSNYAPGDVLIISATQPGGVEKSNRAYDRAVIGVYSTRPGFLGADKNGITQVNADEIPVAITGIVPIKVTNENGAIRPGDLLVTSSTPGYAMNAGANPPIGTVIGKALGALDTDQGMILILVTLR